MGIQNTLAWAIVLFYILSLANAEIIRANDPVGSSELFKVKLTTTCTGAGINVNLLEKPTTALLVYTGVVDNDCVKEVKTIQVVSIPYKCIAGPAEKKVYIGNNAAVKNSYTSQLSEPRYVYTVNCQSEGGATHSLKKVSGVGVDYRTPSAGAAFLGTNNGIVLGGSENQYKTVQLQLPATYNKYQDGYVVSCEGRKGASIKQFYRACEDNNDLIKTASFKAKLSSSSAVLELNIKPTSYYDFINDYTIHCDIHTCQANPCKQPLKC